jgi:uncharacterized membrane protein YdbT with pleckstrin-like domain
MKRASSESPIERELRPKQSTFMILRLIAPTIMLFVLTVGGSVGVFFVLPLAIAGVLLLGAVGLGVAIWAARVAWTKETYRFYADRVVATRGGVVSDQTTELDVRNITQVKLKLPWPRYPLFKVGDVMIESAGSGSSEIVLRSIRDPKQVYEDVGELMQRNGFALGKAELLHEESPDLVGVIIECVGIAFFALIALIFMGAELVGEVAATGDLPIIALLTGVPLAIGGLVSLVLHFLDMRRRTYRVFDDAVVYEEGFLTRRNAYFPAENLADSSTKRTLVDQVLGLYDVGVSCQGSGAEVKFRRLRNGDALSDAIDRLAETFKDRRPGDLDAAEAAGPDAIEEDPDAPSRAIAAAGVPASEAWTAELRMNLNRALLGPLVLCALLLPLLPIWLIALFQAAVKARCTTYEVRGGSVRSSYRFLTATVRDFTYDKITGVAVHEGPLDRMLGTTTVHLWSIGAGEPLVLQHVKADELDLEALLRQAGIPRTEALATMPANFGLGVFLSAHLPMLVMGALTVMASMVSAALWSGWLLTPLPPMGLAAILWVAYLAGRNKRVRATFHEQHIEAQDGLLWRDRYFARYANVKKTTLMRYPWSSQGRVQFFVAGERRIEGKGNKAGGKEQPPMRIVPYGFAVGYVDELERKATVLDDLLERPDRARAEAVVGASVVEPPEPLASGKPALGNGLVQLLVLSFVALPLIALLPFTLPLTFLAIKRRSYRLDPHRAVFRQGILYRSQSSVLYDRIDALRHEQGLFHKLFSNGKVVILTAGSSAPDLVLDALPEYREFHQTLTSRYRRG